MHRIFRVLMGLALVGALLTGCNTLEGLGKDIQSAGRVLEETADRDQ
jgi:predicted small secreted protein